MKKILLLTTFFLTILLGCFIAVFVIPPYYATEAFCVQLKERDSADNAHAFKSFVDTFDEKNTANEAKKLGLSVTGSWKELDNRYLLLEKNDAQNFARENASQFVGTAMKIIESEEFDDTQKMVASMLMQKLPIKEYLCVMDSMSTAIEHGKIQDKDVIDMVLNPSYSLKSTSVNYWWHPAWQIRYSKNPNTSDTERENMFNGNRYFECDSLGEGVCL